jgi:hypothetical protein
MQSISVPNPHIAGQIIYHLSRGVPGGQITQISYFGHHRTTARHTLSAHGAWLSPMATMGSCAHHNSFYALCKTDLTTGGELLARSPRQHAARVSTSSSARFLPAWVMPARARLLEPWVIRSRALNKAGVFPAGVYDF